MITLRGSIVRLATYPLHRPQLRFALRAADRVVAVSESLKRVAIDLGIRADKIRVIPNGVDTSRFFPMDRDDARRRLGLPLDAAILLTVGGVYEGKGQHFVLEALPRLLARDPEVLYVVVGGERVGDSYRHTLDGIIRAHGLGGHVLFVGSKPHEDLRVWYAAADVLCLATRSEGRANVLLESIACGVPVVTTHVGGNPEIVRDGRDGFLVPFGDVESLAAAMDRALHQSWDRGDLVTHARRQSWETTVRAVLEECSRLRRATPEIDEVSTPTVVSGSGHAH